MLSSLFKNPYDKRYLDIAIPSAIEGIFMVLLASADLIMVGSLGAAAIAAVAIFFQPRMVLLCFSRSMASAVTLLVARKTGQQDVRGTAEILYKSLLTSGVLFAVLHLLFYIALETSLTLMGATPDYLPEALSYGRIATLATFITSMTLILQAAQLGKGETSPIMRTNVMGNILNVIVNAFLIFGLGPFPRMGVTGAAIGTVTGTLFTLGGTLYTMQKSRYFTRQATLIPDKAYYKEILPVFISVFSEQGFERIGMLLFSRMAAGLGTIPFAVHSICMSICDIYYGFALGLGKASMVLAGQTCGARDENGWRHYKRSGMKLAFYFSTVSFLIAVLFRKQIFSLYSNDPAALAMSGSIMLMLAYVSYPEAHALICAGILRGSGHTKAVAAYSFISITIFRPIITAVFLYVLEWGLTGVWIALLIDQTTRCACSWYLLHRIKKIE